MKKNKFLSIFIIAMLCIQTSYAEISTQQQSLFAYLYSFLWQEKQMTTNQIPHASKSLHRSIIFDLDGVLIETNKLRAFQEIGMVTILQYITWHFATPNEKGLFDTLQDTPAILGYDAYNKGLRMPNIMIDWQCGASDLQSIQSAMLTQVKKIANSSNNFREQKKYETSQQYLAQVIKMMTMPEKFIATRQTIPAGIALLHELKEKGYNLYILSNWDPTSFPLFMKSFPEIFKYKNRDMFDGIMTSGSAEIVKPHLDIYKKCLATFNLQASQTIFIDDTIENINAAKKCNLKTIHCDPSNLAAARYQIAKLLIPDLNSDIV